jgi:glycosyltransferase involved in cell wall biosynthesis
MVSAYAEPARHSLSATAAIGLDKAIHTRRGPLVLLFYDGFERKAAPTLTRAIQSSRHCAARYLYRTLKRTQVWTGFYTAFKLLRLCLQQAGCDVRVNDFSLARRNPAYPIGLAGYPSVLSNVQLPNPAIFGPGDCGPPDTAAVLAKEERIRRLIQPCEWAASLYRGTCGDKMMVWPVGIDTQAWPDASAHPKDIDVLIYDKLRWNREHEVPRVLGRVTATLQAAERSFEIVRYGEHHRAKFAALLRRSRSMIFLCEHETQGLACQEAMSCNVPVLAWDEGVLVDPDQKRFAKPGLIVSSVPYFDERCGRSFRLAQFEDALAEFWSKLGTYQPRRFVEERLSLRQSARDYLAAYWGALP